MSQETKTIRPGYYNTDSVYEPIKIIRHYNLEFERANSLKYILRAGVKNKETEQEDLIKAITYLQLRVDYLESLKNQNYKKGGEVIQPLKVWDGSDVKKPILESEKKQWHDDVSPKLISDLKVGDEIKAVDYLHMDDDTANLALIKDKYYIIKDIIRGTNIIVASEYDKNHYFKLSDLHEYFHVSKE